MITRAVLAQMRSSTAEATELIAAIARDVPLAVAAITDHLWTESCTMTPSTALATLHT